MTHVGCASPPGDGKDPNGRVACGDRRCCRIDNRRHRSPAPRERASNVASAAAPRHGRAPDLPSVRPVIASPDPEPDGLVSVGSLLRREGRRAAHAVDRPLVPRARDLLEAGARTSTHRAAVAAGALLAVTTVLGSNALGDGTIISGVGVDEAADAGPAAVPPPAEPLPLAAADAPVRQVMAALQSAGTPVRAVLVDGPIGTGLPGSATVSGAGIVAAALGAPAVDQGGTTRSGSSSSDDDRGADDRSAASRSDDTRRDSDRDVQPPAPAATPTGTTAAPGRTTARRRGPSSPCRARIPTCPRPSPARTSSTDRSAVRVRRRTAIPTAAAPTGARSADPTATPRATPTALRPPTARTPAAALRPRPMARSRTPAGTTRPRPTAPRTTAPRTTAPRTTPTSSDSRRRSSDGSSSDDSSSNDSSSNDTASDAAGA